MERKKRTRAGRQPKITPAQGSDWLRSPSSDPLREEASKRARTVVEDEESDETEDDETTHRPEPEV